MADLSGLRLTGGESPLDPANPQTFPQAFNPLIDEVERLDLVKGEGRELDYADITSTFEHNTRTHADVPGLSVTFEADGVTPVMLQAYCYAIGQATAGFWTGVVIREGATIYATAIVAAPMANWITPPVTLKSSRFVPTAGFHTYTVAIRKEQSGAGMATLYAGADGTRSWLKAHTVDEAA